VVFLCGETLAYCAAGAEEADADGGFRSSPWALDLYYDQQRSSSVVNGARGWGLGTENLCGEAFAYCAAGAEETDADGGFGPAVGFGDFLDFVAFEVVTLENHAVVLLAGF
jgi:hypothetical protein